MEDDDLAAQVEPNDDSDSDVSVDGAPSGPLPAGGGKRREVSLVDLQERFSLLEHDFAIFREGMTRPPTRAHDDESAAPIGGRRVRRPSGRPSVDGGRTDGGAEPGPGARPTDAPRSQSVPSGARMLRNPSPADGRCPPSAADDPQLRRRQPSAHPPPRASRPPAAAPAPSVPDRPRPGAAAPERRLPSPSPPQKPRSAGRPQAAADAGAGAAGGNGGKPPSAEKKKVKKKAERPPWRDDFVVQESPWSRELAQEAAAEAGGRAAPAEPQPAPRPRAPSASRIVKGPEPRERRWRSGPSSDGGGDGGDDGRPVVRDGGPSSPGARGAEPTEGAGAPAKRRPQPATAASVRAAAVAAAMEAGRQQQLLQAPQQVSKGGMVLVIPTGPAGPPAVTGPPPHPPGGSEPLRGSPGPSPNRLSHIPSSPPPGADGRRSESRPRTPQSRIPTFGAQTQQPPQQPLQPQRDLPVEWPDRGRRQTAPSMAAAPAAVGSAPLAGRGDGGSGNRPLPGGGISAVHEYDDSLSRSADGEGTPPSSTSSNPQRRRRQWEVPGASPTGEPAESRAGPSGGRRVSGSDGFDDAAAARGQARPAAPAGAGPGPAGGRLYNPTPPPSLPTSRPGSRPGSRPTSSTGEALTSSHGHHHPGSPLAYTPQDARMHTSPQRPTAGDRHSSAGDEAGPTYGALPRQTSLLPDVTFSAGLPPGLGLGRGPADDEASLGRRPISPQPQAEGGDAAAAVSFHMAPAALVTPEATAELYFPPPVASSGDATPAAAAGAAVGGVELKRGPAAPAPGAGPGAGGPRDKEEYRRKLSALKRSVPHDPLRRVTEEGGSAGGSVAVSAAPSPGQSRKWMEPGAGDAPLSSAPVEAVGAAPAAVRAARSRNFSSEVLGSSRASGGGIAGAAAAAGAAEAADDSAGAADAAGGAASAVGRMPRPTKDRSQTQLKHRRSGSMGDLGPPSQGGVGGGEGPHRPSDGGRVAAGMALQPDRPADKSPSGPASPVRAPGTRLPPPLQPPTPLGADGSSGGALGSGPPSGAPSLPGGISAEQYMAFAVQNPEVALAAAQAAVSANGGRARARWNIPQPPGDPQPGGNGAVPPWSQPPPPQPPLPPGAAPPPGQLAAAMVSATSLGIPAVPLMCSPGQSSKPNLAAGVQMPLPGGVEPHDLRRANSEGPRMAMGRPPGPDMPPTQQQQPGGPPSSAPSGSGPAGLGFGPPPGLGPPQYGGLMPPPPMVQGLFQGPMSGGGGGGGGGGGALGWPGPGPGLGPGPGGPGPGEGVQDGSGRLMGYGTAAPYPSALHPIRPAVSAPGEVWAGAPGAGPGPPQLMHPGGLPPAPQPSSPGWNGYGYGPGGARPPGYLGPGGPGMGGSGPGPGLGEPHGPMGHTGPIGGDPYKPLFKRNSNGHYDPFGGAGPGYASAPVGGGPSGGPGYGPGPGGSNDLPDYMRVSMSRMVAGWSAPNAKHGALSGFNDVWQHRNSNRPPPPAATQGVTPPYGGPGGAGGPGFPGAEGFPPQGTKMPSIGGVGGGPPGGSGGGVGGGAGGGGVRETGFDGLSLEQVLASKPKKEMPNFKKKT